MSLGKEPDPPRPVPVWLVTFSDVMSLLLTFFVMLLTFSTQDREQFDKASGSLRGAMGVAMPNIGRLPRTGLLKDRYLTVGRHTPAGMDFPPEFEPLAYQVTSLNTRLKNQKIGASIQMLALSRGVLVRIPSKLVFEQDASRLAAGGETCLGTIADVIHGLPNGIEVAAHLRADFPRGDDAAWEITHQRAGKIAEIFTKLKGIPAGRVCVSGKGADHPIARVPSPLDDRIDVTLLTPDRPAGQH
ncbi:MAG TPA: flagellar motor protein MotB [Planctomycetota bacterium]|nr:flagellar motor protein MotB [Planctomycetota bacterium]